MFGTALLTWVAINANNEWCVALTLFIIACSIGPITGCHINPAVTMGVLVLNYKDFTQNLTWCLLSILAQFSGGLIAVKISFEPPSDANHTTKTVQGAFFLEFVCTFLFVGSICLVKSTPPSKIPLMQNFLVGMSLLSVIYIGAANGICAFNPVIALAMKIAC